MSDQARPLLSIGMIVKNEMRCLERCLKSLQPLRQAIPSELIIADTGSDDGTRELAAQYADVVFDFPWCNDFSAARNAVMDRARGTWFLTIDADEFFDQDVSELVDYLQDNSNRKVNVCTITIRNYNTPDMLGQYTDFAAVRLLRMSTGLRYQGAIHEHWEFPSGTLWHPLSHTMLHHDGYAFATEEESLKKAMRNLKLLEPQLTSTHPIPGNLLLECLDSAISIPEKATHYATECVAWLEKNKSDPYWPELGPAMMRKVIDAADRYHMAELRSWIQQAISWFPTSPFIQIDIVYQNILLCFQSEQYEELLSLTKGYYSSVKLYHQGGFSVSNFGVSGLYRAGEQSVQEVQIMEAVSHTHLQQHQAALQVLESVSMPDSTPPKIAMMWLDAIVPYADNPRTPEIVAQKMQDLLSIHHDAPREQVRRQACLKRIAASFLPGQAREEWRIYQALPFDLGKSAKLMTFSHPSELEALLSEIQNWGEVPPPAINHVITHKAHLPASFYESQTKSELYALAYALPNYDADFINHLVEWPRESCGGLKALEFRLETCFFALCNPAFTHHAQFSLLYAHMCTIGQEFLGKLYHPALKHDDYSVLPELHCCVWYLCQEYHAVQTAAWNEAIHALKCALNALPDVKPIVERRFENDQRQALASSASDELMMLAQKIQAIISQYPPDDPAIEAIKQSDAYRKVAYLIEGMEVPILGGLPQ